VLDQQGCGLLAARDRIMDLALLIPSGMIINQ